MPKYIRIGRPDAIGLTEGFLDASHGGNRSQLVAANVGFSFSVFAHPSDKGHTDLESPVKVRSEGQQNCVHCCSSQHAHKSPSSPSVA